MLKPLKEKKKSPPDSVFSLIFFKMAKLLIPTFTSEVRRKAPTVNIMLMCQSLNIHKSLELPHSTNAQQSITKKSTKEEEKEAEMHQDATKPQDRLLVGHESELLSV